MPNYDFKNTDTGEIFQKTLKMSELDAYMKENPTHQRYYDGVAPGLSDPVRIGVRKPDAGFREVLQKIHEKTPGSKLSSISSHI